MIFRKLVCFFALILMTSQSLLAGSLADLDPSYPKIAAEWNALTDWEKTKIANRVAAQFEEVLANLQAPSTGYRDSHEDTLDELLHKGYSLADLIGGESKAVNLPANLRTEDEQKADKLLYKSEFKRTALRTLGAGGGISVAIGKGLAALDPSAPIQWVIASAMVVATCAIPLTAAKISTSKNSNHIETKNILSSTKAAQKEFRKLVRKSLQKKFDDVPFFLSDMEKWAATKMEQASANKVTETPEQTVERLGVRVAAPIIFPPQQEAMAAAADSETQTDNDETDSEKQTHEHKL